MRKAWLTARSLLLWGVSGAHFGVVCTLLMALGAVVNPRHNDKPQRWFFRNILRLAGVKFEVRRSPGFDAKRTMIFACNHVNLFDPFVIYSAIPQFVRGFELESHFKIPIYGWMMGRFGNIPVPDTPGREALSKMTERARAALESGVSLIVFPEGSRTRDGHVQDFKKGVLGLAPRLGIPVTPMSIVGSYEFFQTGNWKLYPSKITVILHDTIETDGIERGDMAEFCERVRDIVAAPVEEALKGWKRPDL